MFAPRWSWYNIIVMKTKTKNYWWYTLIVSLAIFILPIMLRAEAVNDLSAQIEQKKEEIAEIKKKTAIYQKNIRIKQQEAASLKNQLSILENKIAKTKLDILSTGKEIDGTKLEIRDKELQIIDKEDAIARQRNSLAGILQELHQRDADNPMKIFLVNDSLSSYFNETEYTKDLQNSLQATLSNVKTEKKALQEKKMALEDKQSKLLELKQSLDMAKADLTGETTYRKDLLVQTKNSEEKFTTLYWQAKKEQESISSEITDLEQAMRKKLDQLKKDKPQLTDSQLSWPITENTITSLFHDPDYPFRYLFEHPAIDIRSPQGTTIAAPAEGYVLKAKDAGMGYSYIALIHADGISTVYGHVSKIFVNDDEYVSRGETIGLTGGMPGTPGAGRLSTGSHLHFEVRVNGIPVNPLDYLP